jgi:general secretion pathway protein C
MRGIAVKPLSAVAERWLERSLHAAAALFALIALWLAWRLLLVWSTGIELGPLLDATEGRPAEPALQQPSGAQSIAAWHLFGDAMQGAPRPTLQAPETTLALELRGVIAGEDPAGGFAFIAEPGRAARRYRVGEALPGGATLRAVYADRVLIERAGAEESLRLPRAQAAKSAPAARAAGASAAPPSPALAPLTLPGVELQPAIEALRFDPEAMAREIAVLPVFEGGKLAGVRLSGGRQADLLARLGVLPTDIVTAVNGVPLDSLERGREIVEGLRAAREARVTVRRDGREQTLLLKLDR